MYILVKQIASWLATLSCLLTDRFVRVYFRTVTYVFTLFVLIGLFNTSAFMKRCNQINFGLGSSYLNLISYVYQRPVNYLLFVYLDTNIGTKGPMITIGFYHRFSILLR